MQIINYTEKDAFDCIINNLNKLTDEKYKLLASMLMINTSIASREDYIEGYKGYIDSIYIHVRDCIDTINKEENIYKKMLHYLKLLKFNDHYDYYTDSWYHDYFDEVINLLRINKRNRIIKTQVLYKSIEIGIAHHKTEVTVEGDMDAIQNILTDQIYDDVMTKIPKR